MSFVRPSVQTIYDRVIIGIESRLTGGTALLRRAVLRVLAKVFAGAMHLLYGYVEFVSRQLFVDQAEIEWLDRHGYIWGVTRKASSFASGTITFTGTDGITIPKGTLLQTENGVEFETTNSTTVAGGVASADVVAVEAGASGNFTGSYIELISPISGINSSVLVIIPGITGGIDEESDSDYRGRILERIQNPPMGGTAADYVLWAKSDQVSSANGSVADAWCFPLASGPGTVDVVITAEGGTPTAPPNLIADVQAYIDTVRPVTADVTVLTIVEKVVTMQIAIVPNDVDFQVQIQNNMQDLIKHVAIPGSNLLIAYIRDAIMDSGVENYEIQWIQVDAGSVPIDDIAFTAHEYPVLGTITFTTLS